MSIETESKALEAADNLFFYFKSPGARPCLTTGVVIPELDLNSLSPPLKMLSEVAALETPLLAAREAYAPPFPLKKGSEMSFMIRELEKDFSMVNKVTKKLSHPKRIYSTSHSGAPASSSHSHDLRKHPPRKTQVEVDSIEILPRLRSQTNKRRNSMSVLSVKSKRRATSMDSLAFSEPAGAFNSADIVQVVGKIYHKEADQSEVKIGAYNVDQRMELISNFLEKRKHRNWNKQIRYSVRKTFADSRLRVKGRFISKDDEASLREWLIITM